MNKKLDFQGLILSGAVSVALILAGCSDNDDPYATTVGSGLPGSTEAGIPGGNTEAIAGLWNGTVIGDEVNDVIYYHIAENDVLTRYDDQQDGAPDASGQNCYIVGDPITLRPEGGESYSIADVGVTVVRNDDTLSIVFIEVDKNDVDGDGDTTEIPLIDMPLVTSPLLADLNSCSSGDQSQTTTETTEPADASPGSDVSDTSEDPDAPISSDPITPDSGAPPTAPSGGAKPTMTRAECASNGGTVIGDIGNGAIHLPEYRCESGRPPVATIEYLEGEPIATEGEVCCL